MDLISLYLAELSAADRGSLRSIESSLRTMNRLLLPYGLASACRDEIVAMLGRRGSDGKPVWSPGTRAAYLARLRGFLGWAVETGRIDFSPAIRIKAPKVPKGRPKPWSEDELLMLVERTSGWLLLAVVLAAWSGLRCCEIALVCGADVVGETLTVWRGKGGKGRVVPLHPWVWEAVADLPAGNLMLATGGRDDAAWLSKTARYRLDGLGVRGGLHRGRHRFASRMLSEGASTRHVQVALGHDSLESTQVYTDVPLPELAERVKAIPGVGSVDQVRLGRRLGSSVGGGAAGTPMSASSVSASS